MINKDKKLSFWEGVTQAHWFIFAGCWLGGIFDGMDSNLYAVILPKVIPDLTGTTDKAVVSSIGSLVLFVFLLGWMLGGVVFGYIGDKFGRVKAMIISILLYALFTGLSGFVHEPWQLAACRFLTGLGIGGELVSIATLLSEVWPERSRAFTVGSLITSYSVGVFLSGWVTVVFSDWRHAFFVGALPAVLAVLLRLRLDEPEKWLLDKQHQSSLPQVTSPLRQVFHSQYRWNLLMGSLAFGSLLIGYWASLAWVPTWIQDLLGAKALGLEKSYATQFQGIGSFLGCLSAGLFAEGIGRRGTLILGAAGSFLISCWMFLTNHQFGGIIYLQYAILGAFIGLSQGILYIYLPELFPTRIRATAVGFCLNVGRLATACAVLFMQPMVAFFGGYAQALTAFACCYCIGILVGFFGKETRGQVLPD